MKYLYQEFKSPFGKLIIVASTKEIHALVFEKNWNEFKKRFSDLTKKETPLIKKTKEQLEEYFAGERKKFSLPLALQGTEFQNKVWKALDKIPYGKTCSYKEQAKSINSEKSVRAVGRTNGINPICIILPCHRVIGSDGSLTGYAAGINTKKQLLKLEGAL